MARFNFLLGYEFHFSKLLVPQLKGVMRVNRDPLPWIRLKFRKLERRFRESCGVAMAILPCIWPRRTRAGGRLHDCPVIMGNFQKDDDPGTWHPLNTRCDRFYRANCVYYWKSRKADGRLTFFMVLWSHRPRNLFSEVLLLRSNDR